MQADVSQHQDIDDVVERFSAFPEDLERMIDDRKLGVDEIGNDKWDECELEVLERGLAAIREKHAFDLRREVGEFLFSSLFLVVEAGIVLGNIRMHSPAFWSAIIANSKLILLASVPLLAMKELICGGDYSLFPVSEHAPARVIKREIRAIIAIIIFLDLINLFVGA